jgi:hypothetical protein
MPDVFASVEEHTMSDSAYRLARAGEYAKRLRLRRPPTKPLTFYVGDVLNSTVASWRDPMDDYRWFAYQPIRDDATLLAFMGQHSRDKKNIALLSHWYDTEDRELGNTVASPDVCAVGVGDDPGRPIKGVAILTRWVRVSPAAKRGLQVTYDIYVDVIYVAPKARGNLYGWSLMAYAAHQAFLDLDHLARQMRRKSQQATLQSHVGGQPLHYVAERMLYGLHWQLDTVYRDRAEIAPNPMYRGYTGCEDCID